MPTRQSALNGWLKKTLSCNELHLVPLAGDASFRRYYRLQHQGTSYVVMDAPPDKEAISPFIQVSTILTQHHIHVPKVHAYDKAMGLVLLEDLGDHLLLGALSATTVNPFYSEAMAILVQMQACPTDSPPLPQFDSAFMLQEMMLFRNWFLHQFLAIQLTEQENDLIDSLFAWLVDTISKQPQVFIHRDFHSRNLMVLPNSQLGVIDFQDAMHGPCAYDLVSLLKDCYVQWPRHQVLGWVSDFYHSQPLAQSVSLEEFIRQFDLCGLQRHLKVLGIFCRLWLRDGKPGYLANLPMTLDYVLACAEQYNELQPFNALMHQRVLVPFREKDLSCTQR